MQFYKAVTQWPKSQPELNQVVDQLALFLKTPVTAMYIEDRGEGDRPLLALRAGGGGVSKSKVSGDLLADFFHKHLRQAEELLPSAADGGPIFLRQIEISAGPVPWTDERARHLTLACITNEVVELSEDTVSGERRQRAWVIVATEAAISSELEIALVAASERLSELLKIARLERSIQIRGQFLSIASHELKTPLTSIYGILQLQDRMARLKRESPQEPQDQKRSYLKILLRQVERLNELIDGLLDVSRIQNGRFVVDPSDVDVAALLRDTVQSRLTVIAQEAGVKLQVEAPESMVVWVDPVRMEEVITNLVMNAIRFSPEGGVVWIRLREDGNSYRLTVRDQGPSVPLEDRERIFQPFERAQRTARLGGLGLGLYISRQIALLHGGNVSLIESVPGKGNVFEAYFPTRNMAVISA